jgi:uncharacterized protein (DUF2336 family)
MQTQASLIRDLEASIREGDHNQRVSALRRVTDLFVHRAEQYDDEQIELFDNVIGRLAAEIEKTALAELAVRLAPIPNAPARTIRQLAGDDHISVAGPVLEQSERLSESDLIEIAKTKGQAHLHAISGRRQIGEAVTDILVDRGDAEVAHRVVTNDGARFSEAGFAGLVSRAGGDEALAEGVEKRVDIPPHLFRRLVTEATGRVRERLLDSVGPEMKVAVQDLLAEISSKVEAKSELASRSYSAALSYVKVLGQSNKLGTRELMAFAKEGRFEEAVAALAELARVPIDIVDRVMHGDGVDPVLVLCRAKGFDWATVRPILLIRRNCRPLSPKDLEQACQDYGSLSPSTAERVLRFWQVRQNSQ